MFQISSYKNRPFIIITYRPKSLKLILCNESNHNILLCLGRQRPTNIHITFCAEGRTQFYSSYYYYFVADLTLRQ
jgi:hypothetical protein